MNGTGVYGWNTGEGGTHFHRLEEPLRVARTLGIDTDTGQRLGEVELARFDTIVAYELSQEAASEQWQKVAARGDTRLVFDIDDAMWSPDWAPFKRYYTPEVLERMWRNVEVAHVVTTSSPIIAEYIEKRYNRNVWLCPYTMPAWTLDIPVRAPITRPRYAMGFAGSASHEEDFDNYLRATMTGFLERNREWDWHLWGRKPGDVPGAKHYDRHGHPFTPARQEAARSEWGPEFWSGDRTWYDGRVFTYDWTDHRFAYYSQLRADAIMAPLKPTLFNRCKSALRFIENSALGIATVASDLEPYYGWLEHGVNGYLVGPSGFASWADALDYVAAHPIERAKVAGQARQDAQSWTTEALFSGWLAAWNSV